MSQTSLDLLRLFVQPPGDFAYFLLAIVLSQAMFLLALGQLRRAGEQIITRRFVFAAGGVLLSWLLLFVGAVLANATQRDATAILPPLERVVNVLSFTFLGWALLTAPTQRWRRISDLTLVICLLVVGLAYVVTAQGWASVSTVTDFNLTAYGLFWAVTPLVLAIAGVVACAMGWRILSDTPLKGLFFALMAGGYGVAAYQTIQGQLIGQYVGATRLALVMAMVVALVVLYRLIISTLLQSSQASPSVMPQATETVETLIPSRPVPARPNVGQTLARGAPAQVAHRPASFEVQPVQLLKVMGTILEATGYDDVPYEVVRSTIDALHADVGALLRLQDANYADVHIFFDKVRNRSNVGMSLNLDDQPTLVNSVERRSQRALYVDRNVDELRDLYTRLDIERVGPVYFQPLVRGQEVIAVLMIALPYTERELDTHGIELLKGIGIAVSNLLALSYDAQEARIAAEDRAIQSLVERRIDGSEPLPTAATDGGGSLSVAREQINQLSRQVMELKLRLDDERSRLMNLLGANPEGDMTISQRILAITSEQEKLRAERDQLITRLQEAETALSGALATDGPVENTLVASLQKEKERLEAERLHLQQQLELVSQQNIGVGAQTIFDSMVDESERLTVERDQLRDKLAAIQSQLQSLGLESDVSGLSQLIWALYEERATLRERLETILREREILLNERQGLTDRITHENERDSQIRALEQQLQNLASDRESALKQRDKLKTEISDFESKLDAVKEHRARLLAQLSGREIEITELHEDQTKLRAQVQQLADERSNLLSQRDQLRAEKQSLTSERDQLLNQLDGQGITPVDVGNADAFKAMIEELTNERQKLEQELRSMKAQSEALREQLAILRREDNLVTPAQRYQPQQPDLLVGLVQELRSPMTSIAGYVDLLLGESAGIISEMQRKFLQRVGANINRLDTMINDLIQVTHLDTGQYRLEPRPVDVVSIIEETITNSSIQLREKGIAVNLQLDDQLPPIRADRDAITQIVGQLLTNAYLVSPPDSEISIIGERRTITLKALNDEAVDCVYVAVEDRGGGIQPEDIPRVFARKYRAENPLIQGLGDTGVGLSIAKALVEAHNGILWVETRLGYGSTFNVAIPISNQQQGEPDAA